MAREQNVEHSSGMHWRSMPGRGDRHGSIRLRLGRWVSDRPRQGEAYALRPGRVWTYRNGIEFTVKAGEH